MSTTLSITISADQLSGRSFYYDCFLILAGGELKTSGNASVEASELSPLVLASTFSLESSITVEWLTVSCSRSYNIYRQCTEPSSTWSISTTNTTITMPVDSNSECTLRLVAVYGDGSTGPVTTAVVHPGYPRPTDDRCTSTSQDLILTCQFGGVEYTDIQWTSSSGPINSSDNQLTLDSTTLQRGAEFWCSGVPMGRTDRDRVRGENYVYNESLTCNSMNTSQSPGGEDPAAAAAVAAVVVIIVVVSGGGACFKRRSSSKVDSGDNEDLAPLTALIVAQALGSAGVDVLTVRGCCASSRCQPCSCDWQPGGGGTMDLLCRYREKTVALHILSSQDGQRIHNLETIRNQLSTTDHCFALWLGKSVPKRIREEVSRAIVPEENRHCEVLALPRLPWGMECQERKKFVKQVMAILDPQREPIAVSVESEEGSVAILLSQLPPSLPVPQVDTLRLVHSMFVARPTASNHQEEKTDSSAQPPVPPPATPLIPDVEAPCLTTAVKKKPHQYTKSEVLEGLCSVLTILGAEVLSVRGTCRRRDCVASAAACHHCSVYQPDIVAQHNATTFVVKCVLGNIDGAITADHMAVMNTTRQRLGLSLGILLYDVVGNSPLPQTENCTQFAIGHYPGLVTPWIKRALIVMCASLKTTTITVDNSTPPPDDGRKYAKVDVYSEVVTDGTALDPPKQFVKKNKKVFEDDPKDDHSKLIAASGKEPSTSEQQQQEQQLPLPPPDVAVVSSSKQPEGSSLSESSSEQKNEVSPTENGAGSNATSIRRQTNS